MFCRVCGKEINDQAVICPNCGCATGNNMPNQIANNGNIGWGILGFFIPLIGLILYLVWKDTRPKDSSYAGKGALISVIINVALTVIIYIIVIVAFASVPVASLAPLLI